MKNKEFYLYGTARRVAVCMCLGALSAPSMADFALTYNQGDSNRSRAGGAAVADNATTVFTNPAGLTRLSGQHLMTETRLYMFSAKYNGGSNTDAMGNTLSGGEGGDPGGKILIPSFYYSTGISKHWVAGLGVSVPFGLGTEYDRDWVGRYQTIKSNIETIDINPSVGYKLNDNWSVGAGISAQQASAQLSSAIDFGAICLANADPATCDNLGMPAPQSADGYVDISGDSWSAGFDVGVLWASFDTRVGLSYRSKVSHTFEGSAKFTNPDQAAAFEPQFTNTGAEVPLTLPEIVTLSVYHDWNQRLTVMADVVYTRWSRVKDIVVDFANPAQPDQVNEKNWQDTHRFAVGFDYKTSGSWMLQGGVAFEKSAQPNDTYDPSIPASDAYWLNVGAAYTMTKAVSVSFGWMHIFFDERRVDMTGDFGETMQGETEAQLDSLNARLNWIF